MKLTPVRRGIAPALREADAHAPKQMPNGKRLQTEIDRHSERIGELQNMFYADGRFALLIVLQGRDASGKDGTIKRVFSAVNPMGCEVTSFKAPTELEYRHDFLWRVHLRVPARGMIGIFNRSHYEDVLAPRVHRFVPRSIWSQRYDQINDFERMLARNSVVILKFFLHVSHKEQRQRLEERLTDPTKNWKFRAGDLDDRKLWGAFTSAYRDMLQRCSTPWAPWYVIPADKNHVRDALISRTIARTLAGLKLRFPRAPKSVLSLKVE